MTAPFVKWVGGKGALLDHLMSRVPAPLPHTEPVFYEPFVGGGAFFFALRPGRAYLADANHELINAYQQVSENLEQVLGSLKQFKYEVGMYYDIRKMDRDPGFQNVPEAIRAARFIYLNKTGYNGLWRENSKGQNNVPMGRYTNPTICDSEKLLAASTTLKKASIFCQDFEEAVQTAIAGDFVYFDPPYDPVSQTSNFETYVGGGFRWPDQLRLAKVCNQLHERGVRFLLSNSATGRIKELYKNFTVEVVQAPRRVNSKAEKRGLVDEVLVRNYEEFQ